MQSSKFAYQIISLIILVSLAGCGSKKIKFRSLKSLEPMYHYKEHYQGVTFRVKRLNRNQTHKLLGKQSGRLFNKHRPTIYPLHMSIENNSSQVWSLDPLNIGLELASEKEITLRLQKNVALHATAQAIGMTVTAALIGAAGIAGLIIGATQVYPMVILAGAATCVSSPFVFLIGTPISTTMKSVRTRDVNRQIKKNIRRKTLRRKISVAPGETRDVLVFVGKKDYQNLFDVTLHAELDSHVFTVDMKQ